MHLPFFNNQLPMGIANRGSLRRTVSLLLFLIIALHVLALFFKILERNLENSFLST
jgi:hypothetical protein